MIKPVTRLRPTTNATFALELLPRMMIMGSSGSISEPCTKTTYFQSGLAPGLSVTRTSVPNGWLTRRPLSGAVGVSSKGQPQSSSPNSRKRTSKLQLGVSLSLFVQRICSLGSVLMFPPPCGFSTLLLSTSTALIFALSPWPCIFSRILFILEPPFCSWRSCSSAALRGRFPQQVNEPRVGFDCLEFGCSADKISRIARYDGLLQLRNGGIGVADVEVRKRGVVVNVDGGGVLDINVRQLGRGFD